jgi:hypothetical protein
LFHNTYDFDQGSGVPAPQEAPSDNDTASVLVHSYNSSYYISGVKTPSCRAYYGSTLLADFDAWTWTFSIPVDFGSSSFAIVYKNDAGEELNRKTIIFIRHKISDINGDGLIDITDLAIFAENWGRTGPSEPMADFDGNNIVDITDLAIFAENWGK